MNRITDEGAAPMGSLVPGNFLTAADDDDLVDKALYLDVAEAISRRHRIVAHPVAHQRRRGNARSPLLAGLEKTRRQGTQDGQIGLQQRADRLAPAARLAIEIRQTS